MNERMKSLRTAIFLALAFSPATLLRADETSQKAAAEEMLQTMHMDAMMAGIRTKQRDALAGMMVGFLPKNISADETAKMQKIQMKMMDYIYDQLSWEKLKPEFLQIYVETFSEAELRELTAFYKTSLGQKLLEKTPELTAKAMQVSQKHIMAIMPEIQKMVTDAAKDADEPSESPEPK
jgi:uncharacterized protein